MPSLFTVTTTTNTLHLDRKRQGEVTFTVSNTGGRPVRGRALLQAEDPKTEDWLSLDGEPERDFPIAGTEQYNVKINVPPEATAGSYPFRLDMVNVKRPDEDYSRGQTVTFEVPEAEPEPKPFPVWKALVAAGVLLLIGLVVILWPDSGPHVSGTVTGAATGEPLAGATVFVTGKDMGTTTDNDGTYRIDVDTPEDTLVFGFVGYEETRVAVGERETIDVELNEEIVDIDFTSLGSGTQLGIALPFDTTEAVIRNARELEAFEGDDPILFLEDDEITLENDVALPRQVDFEEEMVLLASRPVPVLQYSLEFEEVHRFSDEIVAQYTVTAPGANCATSPAGGTVGEVILVPRSDLEVRFESRRETAPPC